MRVSSHRLQQFCFHSNRKHVNLPKKILIFIAGLCITLPFDGNLLHAQTDVLESDPLRARSLLVWDEVGVVAGMSINRQSGTLITDCDCSFTGGTATGYVIGAIFERQTRSRLIWGGILGYEGRGINARFREIEGVVQRAPASGREYVVPIEFLNEAEVQMHAITLTPFLKYEIWGTVFGRVGAQIGYVISDNLKHTKSLVTDTVRFPNGESATASLGTSDGVTSVVLQDGQMKDLQPIQAGIYAALGARVKIAKKMSINPVLQYGFPITTVSSGNGAFSVPTIQLLIEARWIL